MLTHFVLTQLTPEKLHQHKIEVLLDSGRSPTTIGCQLHVSRMTEYAVKERVEHNRQGMAQCLFKKKVCTASGLISLLHGMSDHSRQCFHWTHVGCTFSSDFHPLQTERLMRRCSTRSSWCIGHNVVRGTF